MALFFRICLITIILPQMRGYVLFAANLDDFRSIAKKFIPEKLADQLADMASESSVKYYQKAEEKDAEYESNESERNDVTTPFTTEVSKGIAKKRYVIKNQIPEVNLDELVEKVRERLLKGKSQPRQKAPLSGKKYKNSNQNVDGTVKTPNAEEAANIDYSQNSYEEKADNQEPIEEDYEEMKTKRHKPQIKPKIHVRDDRVPENYNEAQYYQQSVNTDVEPNQNGGDEKIFHEFDLRNTNDSYEDYMTPDKEAIFESEESRTTKQRPLRQKTAKKVTIESSSPKDYDDLKARTESMIYDEKVPVSQTTDDVLRNSKGIKGKGTMIPKREYYKMSSPDYYKKLPVIAEKYNFDEPLPEKDREPENLKPIGNPPARINKKVKL